MLFFNVYVLFSVMIPMSAIAYDDKAKWDRYALTMPVSRRDLVISKYLLALAFAGLAVLIELFLGYYISHDLHKSFVTSLTFFLDCHGR